MKLTIISGRSGSGKSVCLNLLEDLGFYCIDNLPIGLLPSLIKEINTHHPDVAVSIDARNLPTDLNRFVDIINELKASVKQCEIIFFDADHGTLLRRFSETRRRHPLTSENVSLKEALLVESTVLEPIAHMADLRIDSSNLTVQQLRELVRDRVTHKNKTNTLSILFESFGYKFGVPTDADYVFDIRCLPNPYWEENLRKHTGLDAVVVKFLEAQPITLQLLEDTKRFLSSWLPHFAADNRTYMTIAIGCTGGRHRSVYFTEQLAQYFRPLYHNVQVRHREL